MRMSRSYSALLVIVLAGFVLSSFALPGRATPERASQADQFRLVPSPQEVQLRSAGGFRVGRKTRILVQFGHQEEDRIAAETLAETVSDEAGLQLGISGMKAAGKAEGGAIVLARLQDARVRRFLARKGLRADDLVGEQGYLLFSDKSHLIVAANSGQGLFSGVQTLRQLLQPAGKNLICPAVTIRDWPRPGSAANNLTSSAEFLTR
jgi:hexosaminidase